MTIVNADVLIACAEPDIRWAEKLWRDLRTAGFDVVIGNADVDARAALGSIKHLVLMWSHHAAQSERVTEQRVGFLALHADDSAEHHLIQVWLDDVQLAYPDRLAISDVRDASSYPDGPDKVEPVVWTRVLSQVSASIRSKKSEVPLDWLETPVGSHSNPAPRSAAAQRKATSGRQSATVDAVNDDYAIVIGIASYLKLSDLPAASADARAFAEWLRKPDGGGISDSRIALTTIDRSEKPLTSSDLVGFFAPLASRVLDASGERIGRRLYLFASGRGSDHSLDDLALCAPAASTTSFEGIRLKEYADWFMNSGAFEEVVLFADCRPFGTMSTAVAAPPPFAPVSVRVGRAATLYCASRTVRGDRAATGASLGPFTQALLEGLGGVDPAGVVTSDSLTRHLASRVPELSSQGQDAQFMVHGSHFVLTPGAGKRGDRASESLPPSVESVAAHADNPALVDELGRRPFAEIIAARIEEVRRARISSHEQQPGAFMVNLHGPWGAGKTSVLNFLKAHLQHKTRSDDERWVVIEFNAWRHQRLQLPWWTLIKEIKTQAVQQLGVGKSQMLRVRWFWWRCRADWLPSIITAILILIAIYLMTSALVRQGAPAAGDQGVGKAVELGIGVLTALLAGSAAVFASSRTLLFGSAGAAQAYMDAKSDPLGPIVRLFQRLVDAIHRPLVVFIDDLDRCDSAYVISLLEGIQTLFRTAHVTYVVAADRKWICSCFDKRYADFAKTISEPGRPLGYLFLDKVFQVSATVPRVSTEVQRAYWRSLLRTGSASQPKAADLEAVQQQAQQRAEASAKDVHTQEQGNQKIEEAKANGPVAEQAMRAAVAKQITSPEAMRETEHRLQPFAPLLEANPRAMKRLVNAYGLYQAAHILERRSVSQEALARWTIVELRWPLLAELLAERPQALGESPSSLPKAIKRLLEDPEVKAVIAGTPPAGDVLDEHSLRQIVGSTTEITRPI